MESTATIIASLISAIGALLSVWLGKMLMKRKCPQDPVVKDTALSANVYTALNYTMEEMGADRAYVLEFHNGGHYYSGRGQQKFSCTHEIAKKGISRECNRSQEHRVSNYHSYISELISSSKFEYDNINKIPDGSFLMLLSRSGVKSILNIPIKTLNGKIIGILGVDYVGDPVDGGFEEKKCKLMKVQARIIAGYLV